jgi:HNH endonuclease
VGRTKQRRAGIGHCIYCGKREGLSDEHVIPYGLGGDLVLYQASCQACADITSSLEMRLLRGHWWAYRRLLGLKSRRQKEQISHLPVSLIKADGEKVAAQLSVEQSCLVICLNFDPPSILAGDVRSDVPFAPRMYAKTVSAAPKEIVVDGKSIVLGPTEKVEIPTIFDAADLCRFLAKVAHGYAISRRGPEACSEYFLPKVILGDALGANTYVGGVSSPFIGPMLSGNGMHVMMDRVNGEYLSVYVQLFRDKGQPTPIYEVVVGRLTR